MENKLSFEEAISQLEHLVSKLEQGDVPLEEAISYFKKKVWNYLSFVMRAEECTRTNGSYSWGRWRA